jgi:hypothetical protein
MLRVEHTPRMHEKRVLCGIFEPKREEVTGVWRTDMKNFVFLFFPTIFHTIKMRMKQVWHIVHIIQFWLKSLRGRGHLEHLGRGGRITLK